MRNKIKMLSVAGMVLTLVVAGCGGYSSGGGGGITHQLDRISDCGGFQARGGDVLGDSTSYCDAEMLHWEYRADTETLKLFNARVLLNCCGDHSMIIEEREGAYVVTETDAPVDGTGRCHCMCVFDFTLEASGIPAGVIQLRLVRQVSDWPEGSGLIFEGELDLAEGSGSVVIDDSSVDPWCEQTEQM